MTGADHLHADILCGNLLAPARLARHVDIAHVALRLDRKLSRAARDASARAASESIITKPGIDLTAEQATFHMAIETLIPHKLRMQYDWLKRNNATLHQIALAFMVPDEIVEHYQSATYDKTSTFAGLSKMINENLLESDIKKLTPPKWFIPQF